MGKLASHTNLGKFKSLQVAILFLEPKEDDLQNVYEVFCSLCEVKILMLDEATVKVKKSRTLQAEIFFFWVYGRNYVFFAVQTRYSVLHNMKMRLGHGSYILMLFIYGI